MPDYFYATPEFPKAIAPWEWYQYPPIEAGAPRPWSETRLGNLPSFLLKEILVYLCEARSDQCDVTAPNKPRRGETKTPFSYFVRHTTGVLGTCSQLRKETLTFLAATTIHTSREVLELPSLPAEIGRHNVTWIQFLKVDTHFFLKTRAERHFPAILGSLCNDLPNLMRFQLISDYATNARPLAHSETHDFAATTRYEQEVRALLRFGAFLILRHKNLDLLVWPCDSGPTYESGQHRTRVYIDVIANTMRTGRQACPRRTHPDGDELEMVEDRILSATKLRRYLWAELPTVPFNEFIISSDGFSSEIDEGHRCFAKVDDEGYWYSRSQHRERPRFVPVDGLIRMCRKHCQNVCGGTQRE
ncbi:hypothetical protein PV08_09121 [Exophiala spinifera]|uniref:Uncharacterized protein n=1 Tax=Exophiala spinifera TaxID=91928 RepID=A0A0D2AYP8_9EURO|nr:uncharacterized protein PV08_09121 [Exophiala spinifera]KIW11848.1 hypothetical protein PV08_09121 [Exophiala spinifera]